MTTLKAVVPRKRAELDIEEAIDLYFAEAGPNVSLRFIDELERTLSRIGRHPAAGSSRYAHELGLPDLRFQLIKGFPYLVFYIERDDAIDMWRVLHGNRDMPSWLQDAD